MRDSFVPFELAKKLNKKGYDGKYLAFYAIENYSVFKKGDFCFTGGKLGDNQVIAPLYQQVVDWFREKHSIDVYVKRILLKPHISFIGIVNDSENKVYECYPNIYRGVYEAGTYYESLNKAIEEALDLIK